MHSKRVLKYFGLSESKINATITKDLSWILGNVTRIPRHELPQTLDFSDFLPLFT